MNVKNVCLLEKSSDKNYLWNCEQEFKRVIILENHSTVQKKTLTFQDSNDNHEISLLREFHDVYYLTKEVSISPTTSSAEGFSKDKQPLPDIGSTKSASSQVTNIFNKVKRSDLSSATRLLVLVTYIVKI